MEFRALLASGLGSRSPATLRGSSKRRPLQNPTRLAPPRGRPLCQAARAFQGPEVKKIDEWRVQKVGQTWHAAGLLGPHVARLAFGRGVVV